MKVLVAVKRVVDYNVKVRAKADGSDVDLNNVKMAINPFCEIAVEEAVRLKEAGIATEVIAVSVGDKPCQEQIRTALALGADRGIQVQTEGAVEPLVIAKLLKGVVVKEEPQLVILGKQSIDGDNNQTGQMLGALAGMPQGTFASEIVIDGDKVMNEEGLRSEREFVQHKLLDAIGDLYLMGLHLIGRYRGYKSGHALHNDLLNALFQETDAFELVNLADGETILAAE